MFTKNFNNYKEPLITFDSIWQSPFCTGVVDACHILIKDKSGGLEANKEYQNSKKFILLF